MATTREYTDYLNDQVDIAPTNSQEELQAAEIIEELFVQHGLETQVQEFDTPSFSGLTERVYLITLFIGILLSGFTGTPVSLVGFVVVAISFVLIFFAHGGNDPLGSVGPRTTSQNVIGVHRATGPNVVKGNRPIVIVAHYDTPRENYLNNRNLAKWQPLIKRLVWPFAIIVMIMALLQLPPIIPAMARHAFWVIGVLFSLPLLLLGASAVYERFAPCTTGASDNKSSVAAMLGVLDMVRPADDAAKQWAANHPKGVRRDLDEELYDDLGYDEQDVDDQEYDDQAYDEQDAGDQAYDDETYDDEVYDEQDLSEQADDEGSAEDDYAAAVAPAMAPVAPAVRLASLDDVADDDSATDESPVEDDEAYDEYEDAESYEDEEAYEEESYEEDEYGLMSPRTVRRGAELLASLQVLPESCEIVYENLIPREEAIELLEAAGSKMQSERLDHIKDVAGGLTKNVSGGLIAARDWAINLFATIRDFFVGLFNRIRGKADVPEIERAESETFDGAAGQSDDDTYGDDEAAEHVDDNYDNDFAYDDAYGADAYGDETYGDDAYDDDAYGDDTYDVVTNIDEAEQFAVDGYEGLEVQAVETAHVEESYLPQDQAAPTPEDTGALGSTAAFAPVVSIPIVPEPEVPAPVVDAVVTFDVEIDEDDPSDQATLADETNEFSQIPSVEEEPELDAVQVLPSEEELSASLPEDVTTDDEPADDEPADDEPAGEQPIDDELTISDVPEPEVEPLVYEPRDLYGDEEEEVLVDDDDDDDDWKSSLFDVADAEFEVLGEEAVQPAGVPVEVVDVPSMNLGYEIPGIEPAVFDEAPVYDEPAAEEIPLPVAQQEAVQPEEDLLPVDDLQPEEDQHLEENQRLEDDLYLEEDQPVLVDEGVLTYEEQAAADDELVYAEREPEEASDGEGFDEVKLWTPSDMDEDEVYDEQVEAETTTAFRVLREEEVSQAQIEAELHEQEPIPAPAPADAPTASSVLHELFATAPIQEHFYEEPPTNVLHDMFSTLPYIERMPEPAPAPFVGVAAEMPADVAGPVPEPVEAEAFEAQAEETLRVEDQSAAEEAEPAVLEPLAVEEEAPEEPAVEEPVAEEPAVEEAVVEEPIVEELVVEEPAVEEAEITPLEPEASELEPVVSAISEPETDDVVMKDDDEEDDDADDFVYSYAPIAEFEVQEDNQADSTLKFEPVPSPEEASVSEAEITSELKVISEPEPEIVPEAEIEPEPEPVAEAEPLTTPEPEPVAEAEPLATPEPELAAEPEDTGEVAPEPQIIPLPTPEPVVAVEPAVEEVSAPVSDLDLDEVTDEEPEPIEEPKPSQALGDTGEMQLMEGLVFSNESEMAGVDADDMDDSGLTTISVEATADVEDSLPAIEERIPKPRAVDDPNWGKTTFKPHVVSAGRRAMLLDLPDPSVMAIDPLLKPRDGDVPRVAQGQTDEEIARKFEVLRRVPSPLDIPTGEIPKVAEPEPVVQESAPKNQPQVEAPLPKYNKPKSSADSTRAPKKATKRKLRFGRKDAADEQQVESMGEWLGLEDDYDAKKDGRQIGSWDHFDDDKGGKWKGGATLRSGLRYGDEVDEPDEVPMGLPNFDSLDLMPVEGEEWDMPQQDDSQQLDPETMEELREAVLSLGDDDLIAHDIWFVGVGASSLNHGGIKAFLADHRSDIRGAFLVNLDSVGAGNLTLLTNEGMGRKRRADRRMGRMLTSIADALHIDLGRADYSWDETDATPAMQRNVRVATIMGMSEDGVPAHSRTNIDEPEYLDDRQIANVADIVAELIRRA